MAKPRTASDLLEQDEARSIRVDGLRAREQRSASSFKDPSEQFLNVFGAPTSSGAKVSESTAATIPVFNACVGILSDMVGKLPLKLYRRTATGAEEQVDHPANKLISRAPGDLHTPFELRQLAQTSIGYGGNGYIRVWRDEFYQPSELQWLQPCDVSPCIVKRSDGRRFARYDISGVKEPLTRADLIHVRGGSVDGLTGISPVRLLRESVGLSLTQRAQAGKIYANGARFPGFLSNAGSLRPEQMKDAREEWQKTQVGTDNSGRTPLLNNGWTYQAVNGMTMADAEFLESRKFERSEIATLFRIPEVLIGNSDKASSWGTGIETLTNGFLTFCLDPWLVNWEQSLNYTLLTSVEQAQDFYFKFNRRALLAVALETQAKFLREMRDIRVYNVNECRAYLDEKLLPAEDGGEDYGLPFNGSGGTAAVKPGAPVEKETVTA